jgi:hypothetical protein
VEPKQSGASPGKARVIEKREILEAELCRGIAQQGPKPRKVRAALGGIGETIAQPPHRSDCLSRIASHARETRSLLLFRSAEFLANKLRTGEYI